MNIDTFCFDFFARILSVQPEQNQRTGVLVRALPGVTFQTDLRRDGFPLLQLRRIPLNFIPEQMWFLSGAQNVRDFLSAHTKIWDSFADEDGYVSSAYGYRWRYHFGVDQIRTVLDKLRADPSSRHGVVMMWDPQFDLVVPQKNVPCPYTFTLNIIGGALHMHLTVRSNDMVLGFPTDVAGFAFLQMMLAQKLGVAAGVYTHSISNAHVYENHMFAVDQMCDEYFEHAKRRLIDVKLPENAFARATELDETLVTDMKVAFQEYKPDRIIKNIPIAL